MPSALGLLLLALCSPVSLSAQTLAVALTDQSRVLLFDSRTYDSVASATVGPSPHEIALAPDGRHLYVGNTGVSGQGGRRTVTRIDVADPSRSSGIEVDDCAGLHDLRVSRSGRLLWIACGRVPAVAEIDLASGEVKRRWPMTLDGGWMLAGTPDERRIFVAHLEGQGVSVIDRERDSVTTAPGPGPQIGIEVTPAGREVWVTAADSGKVTLLDAAGGRALATFPSGGQGPARIRFTPDGRLAVIPHDVSSTLTLLDVASRAPVASIPLAAVPKVLALSPDGRAAAVTHPDAKLISIVDLERRAVSRTIALPGTPDGVAYATVSVPRRTPEAARAKPPERYGFVAVLGDDTVSVERIERSAARLVADGVDRWPFVRLRHTELDLGANGRIRRMVMDVRTPNGPSPAERGRRVTADFTDHAVQISVRDSGGVRDTSFATGGVITVPHASMMYSVIELEIAAALRQAAADGLAPGDSVPFRQFYPDRDVGPSFTLHRGYVHPRAGGKVELRHGWLSGTGDATVDGGGRMMAYSGMRSTYKVAVTRTATPPDIQAIGERFTAAERRTGRQQLSVRDTARATVDAAAFSVDYGRPLARGRTLLGDVIAYDRVWRTGANAATQLTISAPITLSGLSVPAGTYTLWTVPRVKGVQLIVNKQTGQWGTEYGPAHDLGKVPMKVDTVATPVEKFTIAIEPSGARHGTLVMAWGKFRWTAPFVVQ